MDLDPRFVFLSEYDTRLLIQMVKRNIMAYISLFPIDSILAFKPSKSFSLLLISMVVLVRYQRRPANDGWQPGTQFPWLPWYDTGDGGLVKTGTRMVESEQFLIFPNIASQKIFLLLLYLGSSKSKICFNRKWILDGANLLKRGMTWRIVRGESVKF